MVTQIIDILKHLVSFESISPNDKGAILFCKNFLDDLGFKSEVLTFSGVNNLYSKLGDSTNNLCFAGHVDVVPALDGWTVNPFELSIKDEMVYGRGTNDMKGPLAACLSAIYQLIFNNLIPEDISISVLLTSDEEIMGDYGTKSVVNFLKQKQEKIKGCILCESCSLLESGEYIKIGSRGSLNVDILSEGMQSHVANAPTIGNHIHGFLNMLNKLCEQKIDNGNEKFAASSIQLTSLKTPDNSARNIVPSQATALLNIRFNDNWTFESLENYIRDNTQPYKVSFSRFGYPFIGSSPDFINFLSTSVEKSIGRTPQIGTEGGNSDAVFIKEITDVCEVGSAFINAHIKDEFITLTDLAKLSYIYKNIILDYIGSNSSYKNPY
jgi:succinyl-diaminopimelate desuccinylase